MKTKVVFMFMFLDEKLRKVVFRTWSLSICVYRYKGTKTMVMLGDKAVDSFLNNKKNAEIIKENEERLNIGDGFFITATIGVLSEGRLLLDHFTAGEVIKSLKTKLKIR